MPSYRVFPEKAPAPDELESIAAREGFDGAHAARVEVAAYGAAVTDWERYRGFERL